MTNIPELLNAAHRAFLAAVERAIPAQRLITDPTRTLAYGTDASFYRLIPQIVVRVESEAEVQILMREATRHGVALTFRAAGTSLSGQSVSDSVLVMLGDNWTAQRVVDAGERIVLQPGVIGQRANDTLKPYGRKIGPDPASIASAKIGGIAANNSSGMCCGTVHNSYHTLDAIRVVLADGTVLDTADECSLAAFRASHAGLLLGLEELASRLRADPALEETVRRKYRLKNTTGYGINALLDFSDPVQMLAHLMIGSEGTLGFISSVTYRTVVEHPHKASALALFDDLDGCCRAVTALREQALCSAVELIDAKSIRAVQDSPGMPEFLAGDLTPSAAALLIETRAASGFGLAAQASDIAALLDAHGAVANTGFSSDPALTAQYWQVRAGLFPAVGAVRATGTTVVIEDVAFPIERLAEGVRRLTALFDRFGYSEALVFGHALEGNLHFVFTPSFDSDEEVARYSGLMDAVNDLVAVEFGGSLKAEHGTGRNVAPFVRLEWGDAGYALMQGIKALLDPAGILNPDVILSADPDIHLKHLKAMPAADPLVDRCTECGFCEPVCPSQGLSLTPRQRIVVWRAISALRRSEADPERLRAMETRYRYAGIETCATTGMCQTRCPVSINAGALMKKLQDPATHPRASTWIATHMAGATALARGGLAAWRTGRRLLGEDAMRGMNRLATRVAPTIPIVPVRLPAPAHPLTVPQASSDAAPRVVFYASCVNRTLADGRSDGDSAAHHALNLLRKAGYQVVLPSDQSSLCCGQPFDSKNADEASGRSLTATAAALREASENGRLPVYVDNSPCALRLIEAQRNGALDAGLQLFDSATFLSRFVASRLSYPRRAGHVALHLPCSTRKMKTDAALLELARRCAHEVTVPDIACCGFAGDKGFTTPELNANSLRHLAETVKGCESGVTSSRTCQIGLSVHGGIDYRSIEALLDAASEPATVPA